MGGSRTQYTRGIAGGREGRGLVDMKTYLFLFVIIVLSLLAVIASVHEGAKYWLKTNTHINIMLIESDIAEHGGGYDVALRLLDDKGYNHWTELRGSQLARNQYQRIIWAEVPPNQLPFWFYGEAFFVFVFNNDELSSCYVHELIYY